MYGDPIPRCAIIKVCPCQSSYTFSPSSLSMFRTKDRGTKGGIVQILSGFPRKHGIWFLGLIFSLKLGELYSIYTGCRNALHSLKGFLKKGILH
jgi:hypothetical protein